MNAPETSDGGEAGLREERRQFKRACVCAGLALFIYVGVKIFVWLNADLIACMIALEFGGLAFWLCCFVLARAVVKWLLAIRRRRRQGAGLPPAALL